MATPKPKTGKAPGQAPDRATSAGELARNLTEEVAESQAKARAKKKAKTKTVRVVVGAKSHYDGATLHEEGAEIDFELEEGKELPDHLTPVDE